MNKASDKKSIALTTLGCKVNQCESAALIEDLQKRDFQVIPFTAVADFYIINTCTVTTVSDFQARQLIHRARRLNPQAKIIVTGCYAQVAAKEIAALEDVDLIVGNDWKNKIPGLLHEGKVASRTILAGDISEQKDFSYMPLAGFTGRTRAFLKIQDGCNASCSYCIVPQARGPSRSLPVKQVLAAVDQLISNGYREIVFTGIHLGTYGQDLRPACTLIDILQPLLQKHYDVRFRLSSIEPREISDELLQLFRKQDSLCPHLHIPLQSGDDKILQLMKRNYNTDFYQRLIEKTVSAVGDIAIGVDVMVGFPGEGENEFQNTLNLLTDLPIAYLHVFPYSERPGTPAQKLASKVPEKIKKERVAMLRTLSAKKKEAFAQRFLGENVAVLIEKTKDKKTGLWKGFSQNYLPVLLAAEDVLLTNKIVNVRINQLQDGKLYGTLLDG